jgi:phosphopentomutase
VGERTERVVFLVLDGLGAGSLPDAAAFGDEGSNTLAHIAELACLRIPVLQRLGLGNILALRGIPPVPRPLALPGILAERSAGKDSTAGHWEHMGLVTEHPFPVYPAGFPAEVIGPFSAAIGRGVLGNKPASGTAVIDELGEEHLATGRPIVYTSADSVFQIAAHVDIVPLEELYRWCRLARDILAGPHAVSRVIARPFSGAPGAFRRTADRRDFSLPPSGPTYLDLLVERGIPVLAVGKISQLFAARGITREYKAPDNETAMRVLLDLLDAGEEGLLVGNLVDFDMTWGHRNDVDGFAAGLARFDGALAQLMARMRPRDRLIITADHGTDPATLSYDHSREYAPLLLYPHPAAAPAACFEGWFSDTGATAYALLTGESPPLAGRPIGEVDPERGWKPYPAVVTSHGAKQASRVGRVEAEEAAGFLRIRFGAAPEAAVILGSGLDAVSECLQHVDEVPFRCIPHWASPQVTGHAGVLAVGRRGSLRVAVLRGRAHGYEGLDRGEEQLAVRTLSAWGIRKLLITNASGALRGHLPGAVLVVRSVLDLQGPDPETGPIEIDATAAEMVQWLRQGAGAVYVAVPGPQYETAAEVAVLRLIGGDVVGMSTAAELEAATEENMEIVVLSVVTNAAGAEPLRGKDAHSDVVDMSGSAVPEVVRLLDLALTRPA